MKRIAVVLALCCMLSGCAALSAVKGLIGAGDSTDKSVNVEANLAAKDNNKAIMNSTTSQSYRNKGNVISNGLSSDSLWKVLVASAAPRIDLLLIVLGWLAYKAFDKYMDVRADIWERRFRLKMEKIKAN